MGRTVVCTGCDDSFRVGEARPPFEWKPTQLAEDSWIGVSPPEEKKEIPHCINCDAPLEPGSVTCLACGMNQVTGTMHRRTVRDTQERTSSFWSAIPMRMALSVVVVGALAGIAFWIVHAITRSAEGMGEDLKVQGVVMRAAKFLRDGNDAAAFARQFGGEVTDENLPRYMDRLSARDPTIRSAAVMLIGAGSVTNLAPILALAKDDATPEQKTDAHDVLDAIGARRLVQLASGDNESTRRLAARALCIVADLRPEEATLARLAAAESVTQKLRTLNDICGAWPQATGPYVVVIGDVASSFRVTIQQVGHDFYMQAGTREFRSSPVDRIVFEIPLAEWCAATSPQGRLAEYQALLTGSMILIYSDRTSWGGTVRGAVHRALTGPLPGFLPVEVPPTGGSFEVDVRLDRPPS